MSFNYQRPPNALPPIIATLTIVIIVAYTIVTAVKALLWYVVN